PRRTPRHRNDPPHCRAALLLIACKSTATPRPRPGARRRTSRGYGRGRPPGPQRRTLLMCLNCGCGDYNNEQGNPANITIDDLDAASRATGQDLHATIDNMERSLDEIEAEKWGVGYKQGSAPQAQA